MSFISDDFIKKYENIDPPFGGNGLGEFIYLRTYARWIPDNLRREFWAETIRRAIDYSLELYKGPATKEELREEAEELFDNMFHLKVFPAGRTLWIGGTAASNKFALANFNCSFAVIDNFKAFVDGFYLLMVGAGFGFRVLKSDVEKLPTFNNNIVLANKPYHGKDWYNREESTLSFEDDGSVLIVVGDSKEGWVEALRIYFESMQRTDVESIIINYDSVRPKGEILKTFGGRSSGHEALKDMFKDIHKIMKSGTNKLTPLQAMDIMNIIGRSVVVGGVRRSSEICLFSPDDNEILNAKFDLWSEGSPNYHARDWRGMSNNSIFFEEKPSRETLVDIFNRIKNNGEPGFVNAAAARKRRPWFQGLNPCAEILLDSKGVCNLTNINMRSFVLIDEDGAHFDQDGMIRAVQLATRIGLRQTNAVLDLSDWDEIQRRDRLVGPSLDGVVDTQDAMDWDDEQLGSVLDILEFYANQEAMEYAKEMRIPAPLLVTTSKPSGTLSLLPVTSAGCHRSRAPYYIRRVRITSTDPLARVMRDMGYPVYPEGTKDTAAFDEMSDYERLESLQNSYTWVIEFPVKTTAKIASFDEDALDQFNRYLTFQRHWTNHNTSITITFKPEEIDGLVDAILEHWDEYVAISFLPAFTDAYPLLPEEPISEKEYEKRAKALKNVTPKKIREALTDIEREDAATEILDDACATGACPIR